MYWMIHRPHLALCRCPEVTLQGGHRLLPTFASRSMLCACLEALGRQVPVSARALAGQLQAAGLPLLHYLAQPKVLSRTAARSGVGGIPCPVSQGTGRKLDNDPWQGHAPCKPQHGQGACRQASRQACQASRSNNLWAAQWCWQRGVVMSLTVSLTWPYWSKRQLAGFRSCTSTQHEGPSASFCVVQQGTCWPALWSPRA